MGMLIYERYIFDNADKETPGRIRGLFFLVSALGHDCRPIVYVFVPSDVVFS